MSRKFGYSRVSTSDQSKALQQQRVALETAGADVVVDEVASGKTLDGRPELKRLIEFAREGDVIIATRIDRLARSIRDLQDIIYTLREKGVALKCTEQPVDTSNSMGKMFVDLLGVFAEFELNIRRERQREGIERAKKEGVYRGRKPKVDRERIRKMHAGGMKPSEIAESCGVSRVTVWRALQD